LELGGSLKNLLHFVLILDVEYLLDLISRLLICLVEELELLVLHDSLELSDGSVILLADL